MSDILTIGQTIALIRKAKNLTQEDLSYITGKSRSAIAQIEKNMMKPDYEFIRDIVRNLNIPYEVIMEPKDGFEKWIKGGLSKNEMYIKSTSKGGDLISEKGGDLMGDLIENEMYIKPESKAYDTEKHHRDPGSVSDPQETYYLDLKKLITRIEADKSTLLSHLLDRMHSMELQIQELTKKAKK